MVAKKILLSAYACSPIRGSEPGNGWAWAVGLARRGFHVWCFTNVEDREEIIKAHSETGLMDLHFVFIDLPGSLDRRLLNTDSKTIYLHYKMWQRRAAVVARKLHASVHFDIAHHVTFGSLQQGNFLWKLNGVKKIFGPVGGGQKALPIFKEYFGGAWKIEKLRDVVTTLSTALSKNFKNSILKSDYVLVSNADTFEMAKKVLNGSSERIQFVPDASIPTSMEHIGELQRNATGVLKLLWVGRLLPRKGLNLVLEALSKVPDNVAYELSIIGGGEWFHLIDDWIKNYGFERSKIKISGQIPFEDVLNYYRNSDVFIFCSLRDSFGAQLHEAMAFGLPIITLNTHGAALFVPDDAGIKVTPVTKEQTISDIAKAVVKMHDDEEFRRKCGHHSYLNAQKNTWQVRIDTVVEKYY